MLHCFDYFSPSDSPRKVWVRWTLGLPEQLKSTNWVLCTELHGQHSLTDVRKRRQINARCKAQTNMNMATRKPEKVFITVFRNIWKNCFRNTGKTRKHLCIKLTYVDSERANIWKSRIVLILSMKLTHFDSLTQIFWPIFDKYQKEAPN